MKFVLLWDMFFNFKIHFEKCVMGLLVVVKAGKHYYLVIDWWLVVAFLTFLAINKWQ